MRTRMGTGWNRHALIAVLSLALAMLVSGVAQPLLAHEAIYTAQEGETLSEIAQRFGTTTETLRQMNELSDADLIYYGLPLLVPDYSEEEGLSAQPQETPAGAEYYVIAEGENLTGIANVRNTSVAELVALNQLDPDEALTVGTTILVPLASATPDPLPDRAANEQIEHTVKRGEHLGILANRYGVPANAIARANNLSNADIIVPGQQLTIPTDQAGAVSVQQSTAASVESLPLRTGKWIDVDLSEQTVVAYEDMTPIRTFLVSTGLPGTPTVQGEFNIWAKTSIQDMYGGSRAAGDYYYLEDVKWVQYFFEDYAFHGTYWHNNFGQPMSRGCVNMRNEDAKWLFEWAAPEQPETNGAWLFSTAQDPGTLVVVHE